MHLTPDLIDHTEFHTGLWLQNAAKPGWYYFSKRKNPNIVSRSSFIETVDPELRELVTFLHRNKIRTSPSCAGHSYAEKKIERLYDSIASEAIDITSKGIYLKDVQTDKLFHYRNEHYKLPWSKSEFTNKLMKYQTRGILGIHQHNKLNVDSILKSKVENTKIYTKDNILFFLCDNSKNSQSWKMITRLVKENVKEK